MMERRRRRGCHAPIKGRNNGYIIAYKQLDTIYIYSNIADSFHIT
jgi:hypothetical protein